jgi:hypothetical protein
MFPMFHRAVQKEVIHRLPTAVTRTTLPYQCIPPPHKVHTSEYPQAAVQTLKETPWDFDRPNTLPSEFQLTRATLGTLWQQKPTQKQPRVCSVCVCVKTIQYAFTISSYNNTKCNSLKACKIHFHRFKNHQSNRRQLSNISTENINSSNIMNLVNNIQ